VFNYIEITKRQQPTCENGTETAMVMMKKKQVGDDNMFTSARITTLFTEATKRGIQTISAY